MAWAITTLSGLAGVEVGHLRHENMRDPLGIDSAAPRFSWLLNSERRGVKQTFYSGDGLYETESLKDEALYKTLHHRLQTLGNKINRFTQSDVFRYTVRDQTGRMLGPITNRTYVCGSPASTSLALTAAGYPVRLSGAGGWASPQCRGSRDRPWRGSLLRRCTGNWRQPTR